MKKVHLTSQHLKTILKAQDIAYEFMRKSDTENMCICLLCKEEVDQERFYNIMSCICGAIEELAELYLERKD